jgi:hypothetical protein
MAQKTQLQREVDEILAPDEAQIASVPVFRPKRREPIQDTGRKQKIYQLIQGGGIWFKLSQADITIYDSEKDTVRAIRYCPNEPSIYTDEQSSNAKRSHIIFVDKVLGVPASQPNLQNYLDKHPGNAKNGGGIFYEINHEQKTDTLLQDEFLIHDAISLIRDKSIDELLPVIMYLGISTDQRNQEIRRELLLEAKSNPKAFIEMFDNPIVKMRASIKMAADCGIIRMNQDGTFWADSNRLIIATPMGQDGVDMMTKFCLSEKGIIVHQEILKRLEKFQ